MSDEIDQPVHTYSLESTYDLEVNCYSFFTRNHIPYLSHKPTRKPFSKNRKQVYSQHTYFLLYLETA